MNATHDADAAAALRNRAAWLCAGLMLVVVVASAVLRHQAGAAADGLRAAEAMAWVRHVHRVAATLVLLGAVGLVVMARRSRHRGHGRLAQALLAVALLLSVVGIAAGASRAAPVVMVNLLGGFVMLVLCLRLTLPTPGLSIAGMGSAAWWLLGLAALQAAGGAWASAHATLACVGLIDCDGVTVAHRMAGMLLGYGLLLLGILAAWRGRRAGAALACVALALLVVGMLASGLGATTTPETVVLHNLLAAVAVGLVARLA